MPFLRSVTAFSISLASLVFMNSSVAHGFTDEEWAMIFLTYKKACEETFPERKSIYDEALLAMETARPNLGFFWKNIEKDKHLLDEVNSSAQEMLEKSRKSPDARRDLENECKAFEDAQGRKSQKQETPKSKNGNAPTAPPNSSPNKKPILKPVVGDTLSFSSHIAPNSSLNIAPLRVARTGRLRRPAG